MSKETFTMAWRRLWTLAYRDLLRNQRRSILTLLAVALGYAMLMILNGWVAGILEDALQNSIRLQTGHVQVRNEAYEMEKLSLLWSDLLEDPGALAARAEGMPQVKAAAPVLWASGILSTIDDTAGLQVYGIETASPLHASIREAMVAGDYLTAEDRDGILIGQRLADDLGVGVGQKVNLAVVDADGRLDEGVFAIRGLFSTGIFTYDDGAAFLPLSKAQAFTGAGDRASAVVLLLNRQDDADTVAAALQAPGAEVLTWRDLNALLLTAVEMGMSFYYILDLIVMLIVAVIIANTLLMSVFERFREMGILAALGMTRGQIRWMFLLEAVILGLAGLAVGFLLGSAGVLYLSVAGVPSGDMGAAAGGVALGSVMYARFVPGTFLGLGLGMLIVILLASLYPAWFASRLEPVEALHSY
jgi:ABC-type lipoprotein release transport system permease subunit